VSVPEADQDKELSKNIIKEELPGIFNWVLKGLDRLIANKNYTQCEASITTVNEYKKQSNTVLLFIDEEEYAPSLTNTLTLKQLYSEYSTFCRELGYRAVPNNIFSERLKKAGFETNRSSSGVFVYIVKKGSKLLALMS
jgi:putative DNA primase/helicase